MQTYSFHVQRQVFNVKGKQTALRMPFSLNKRVHWHLRGEVAKSFRQSAYWETKTLKIPPTRRICIEVENYTTHRMDRDNLYGAMKPIVDGIVDTGIVCDDSDEYVEELCKSIKVTHKIDEKLLIKITVL